MPPTRPPYRPEFRQQVIELRRAGRSSRRAGRSSRLARRALRRGLDSATFTLAVLAPIACGACTSTHDETALVSGRRSDAIGPPEGGRSAPPPGPAPHGSFSEFSSTHFSGVAWNDLVVRDYLTAPPVVAPAALAVAAGAVAPWDHSLAKSGDGWFGGSSDTVSDVGLTSLVVWSVATGLLAPGEGRTAYDETWTQAETFALTIGVTEGVKPAVGRRRPDSNEPRSFPSGHASVGFAAATLIYRNSGPEFGIPAYGVAAVTGLSRVHDRGHFPSDVLAGAALGVLAAGVVDALHFGAGREGAGIARSRSDLALGFEPIGGDGLAAVLTLGF